MPTLPPPTGPTSTPKPQPSSAGRRSREPERRCPRPAHPAADPRRRPPGVRRGRLPPVPDRPDHQAGRVLTGVLLPVLLQQGRPLPPAHRTGGARELSASTEALGPITADEAGWIEVREWVAPLRRDLRRNEPVFHAFERRRESDDDRGHRLPSLGRRTRPASGPGSPADRFRRARSTPCSRCSTRPRRGPSTSAGLLRSAVPGEYSYERVEDALADLVHRSLFGRDDTVNVHPRAPHPPRALRFDPLMGDAFARAGGGDQT